MKKIISLVLAVGILAIGVTTLAKFQSGVFTYAGVNVTATLGAEFKTLSNDTASAKTSWSGKTNYGVRSRIYYWISGGNSKLGSDVSNAKEAYATVSNTKVVQFESWNSGVDKKANTEKILKIYDDYR